MKVDFFKHNISDEDIKELEDTLRTPFLTTGPKTARFEAEFGKYTGCKHVLGFTSWTNAAFLVLKAWGIKPGDEVIVPPLTFVATANIVEHCGAKPVFVDVERDTGNMDANRVASVISDKTKVILPVHLYGQLADVKALRNLSSPHGIRILEDAAHCIEGTRDGYRVGDLSDAACYSFYATKNLTCGEGGAVATNESALFEKLKLFRLHGMSKSAAERYTSPYEHWDMELLGYKANMSDISASLLIHQIKRLDQYRERKEAIARFYEERLTTAGIEFPQVLANSQSARHLFTFWVPEANKRDRVLAKLQERGIGIAVNFRAIHLLTYYREKYGYRPGDFLNAETIGSRTITIPLYPKLSDAEVDYVAKSVIDVVKNI